MTHALLAATAALGWALALLLVTVVLPRRARRETEAAQRLRTQVEPYLRRRAAELTLVGPPPQTEAGQPPEQIVATLCELADRLTEQERAQVALGDTLNIAVSSTMPLSAPKPTSDK